MSNYNCNVLHRKNNRYTILTEKKSKLTMRCPIKLKNLIGINEFSIPMAVLEVISTDLKLPARSLKKKIVSHSKDICTFT